MDISVSPADVLHFANQLKQWAQSMNSTRQNIISSSRQLENKWRDPQYQMFVQTATNQAKSLGAAIDQFETMSKELQIMGRSLENMQREMQARIRNMGR
jgi:hypothetical protein